MREICIGICETINCFRVSWSMELKYGGISFHDKQVFSLDNLDRHFACEINSDDLRIRNSMI